MNYYLEAFTKKYFVFSGRASRAEFWSFFLWHILALIILSVIDGFYLANLINLYSFSIASLYGLLSLAPFLAIAVRRFHDINKSGAFFFTLFASGIVLPAAIFYLLLDDIFSFDIGIILLLLIIGFLALVVFDIIIIVFLAKKGNPNDNQYGPVPGMQTYSKPPAPPAPNSSIPTPTPSTPTPTPPPSAPPAPDAPTPPAPPKPPANPSSDK